MIEFSIASVAFVDLVPLAVPVSQLVEAWMESHFDIANP